MLRINLVAQAERRRLIEHEERICSASGSEVLLSDSRNGKTARRARMVLITRVRSYGWTVAKAAASAGVSRQTAHTWLRDGV